MIRLFGRPSGPTHPTGPAGPGPTGPAGPSPSGPVGPHPSPSGPPSPSPTSGTGAPWPARPGGSSGPGGPAGPGREDWLAALIDDVDAEHVASVSRVLAAVEDLLWELGPDHRSVQALAEFHGVKLPAHRDPVARDGGLGVATTRGSGREAGGGTPHAVPGAPPMPWGIPGDVVRVSGRELPHVRPGDRMSAADLNPLPPMQAGVADYGRRP